MQILVQLLMVGIAGAEGKQVG